MLTGLRLLLVASLVAVLSACGTLYVAQAARGHWHLMRARQPLETVITDSRTPETLRTRLREVRAARDFASAVLGLPDNLSYRSYTPLDRPFVVWNVVAAPEFSVYPVQWCFPITGCVAYRGYFAEKQAQAFAEGLRRKGFDTVIGGVPAYSTLGRFADPVLSTMMGYGDVELAAIIFHELAHQVAYAPGDSAFNEAFATTVEQAGLTRWLASRARENELALYLDRRARQVEFLQAFSRRRGELARLYDSGLPVPKMRQRKRELFAALVRDIEALNLRHGPPPAYQGWIKQGLNNAHLASVATYFECMPAFERLLQAEQGDLKRFYSVVRGLARLPAQQRHSKVCGFNAGEQSETHRRDVTPAPEKSPRPPARAAAEDS